MTLIVASIRSPSTNRPFFWCPETAPWPYRIHTGNDSLLAAGGRARGAILPTFAKGRGSRAESFRLQRRGQRLPDRIGLRLKVVHHPPASLPCSRNHIPSRVTARRRLVPRDART